LLTSLLSGLLPSFVCITVSVWTFLISCLPFGYRCFGVYWMIKLPVGLFLDILLFII
jgi:hypothetical protein